MEDEAPPSITELTASVVSAFVEHNSVSPADLPPMIAAVYTALAGLGSSVVETVAVKPDRKSPAQIRASIQPDGIVSFITGQKFRTLRRHLTANDFTPASYFEKYGLDPRTYPLVCSQASEIRSTLAKSSGLGNRRAAAKAKAALPAPKPVAKAPRAARKPKGALTPDQAFEG